MNLLDARTVVFSYAISNLICTIVIAILWKQNRTRLAGLGFWLVDFVMQFIALLLVALRGIVPDFLSMTVSNTMVIGGTILLLIGLEHFTEKRGPQVHNYILLAVFIVTHSYFVFVLPNLAIRNIIISLGLLVICSHAAWLMLHRVEAGMRLITRGVGQVFLGFCLVSIGRIIVDLIVPLENDFFHSNAYDTLLLMTYQMLFVALTFSLFLMVNRRLFTDLEGDITTRKQAEAMIANLAKFPDENPNPIMRIARNGNVLYANPSANLLLQSLDSAVDRPAPAGWRDWVTQAFASQTSQNIEIEHGGRAYACELVPIRESDYVNLYARDITERKQVEAALEKHNRALQILHKVSLNIGFELETITLLNRILNHAVDLFDADRGGGIYLYDSDEHALRLVEGSVVNENRAGIVLQLNEGVVGRVFQTSQPLIVNDYTNWEGRATVIVPWPPSAVMGVPLLLEGQAIGVLNVFANSHRRIFIQADVQLAQMFAAQAVTAIRNVQLYEQAQGEITKRKRAEEIFQMRFRLLEFAASHSPEELMQRALDEIGHATDSPIGFYHFVEADQKTLSLQAWSTRTEKEFCKAEGKGMHYSIDQAGVWVDCVRQRKPVIHNDYAALPHRKGLPDGHAEVIRELVVPILREGRIVSILGVGNKPSDYDDQDVEFVTYIADVLWEITQRKRAEQALLESEERLRSIFENVAIGLYRTTRDGRILLANTSLAHMFGCETVAELMERNNNDEDDLVTEYEHGEFLQIMEMQGEVKDFDAHWKKKDGTVVFVRENAKLVRDSNGDTLYFEGTIEDVTARKLAEEKLQQLSRAVEQSPASIVITDTKGNIEYVNPKFSEVTGYTLEEAIGKNPRILKTDQTPEEVHRQLWEAITSGREWRGEFVNRKKNGELYYELASISPITDDRGIAAHYVAVKEDITERKRAEVALARHDYEISTLYEASLEINSFSDISTLLHSIIRRACDLLKIRSGALYLFKRDDKTLELVISHHLPNQWVGIKIRQDEGLVGRVFQTKKPIVVEDYQNWEGRLEAFRDTRARRVLGVPLIIHDQVTGVIVLLDEQVGSFSDNDIRLMSLFADQAAIAVENARLVENLTQANDHLKINLAEIQSLQAELREQAIRDPLTGLYNRRYLNETLERELARAVRESHPISFVMMDIDHFKKINDTFGHDTGDVVLKKLAAQLLSQTRVVDIVCRYGGEEFLIILPNVMVSKALEITERWRKSFMGMTIPLGHHSVQTTISCGISVFPLNGNTGEELISNADKAMYQAKAAGRNRVVVWKNEMTG